MKVFIITRGYPHKKNKLNGIFELDQAVALRKQGLDIVYLALDCRSIRKWRKFGRNSFEDRGVKIEELNIPINGITTESAWYKIGSYYLRKLYEDCVKKYGLPDIVHSHFLKYTCLTARSLQNSTVPLIATEHYSRIQNNQLSAIEQREAKTAYSKMRTIITVSDALGNKLKENFQIDSVTIPNMVDTELYAYDDTESSRIKRQILSIGCLRAGKRMDLLIEAFSKVRAVYADARLVIYGDGDQKKNLQNLIRNKNLDDCVELMGFQPREVIRQEMKKSDFFVLASECETFGVVFIEAMVAGLPVVCTMCGGPEEFITCRQGLLTKKNDLNELTANMLYMCEHADKYDRKEISDHTIHRFGTEYVAKEIINLYSKL